MIKFDFDSFLDNSLKKEIDFESSKLTNVNYLFSNDKMLDWFELDQLFNDKLIADIKETAAYIKNNCDVFLVLGIGGSFLGAKAVIEALNPYFYNDKNSPKIYFGGNSLSSDYYRDLIEIIRDKEIIINVISKSGTTLETDIFYNLIIEEMKKKYTDEVLRTRIIITTSENKGDLWDKAIVNNYKKFIIPDNIGGRYSVFSPVGLLPIAVSGLDLYELYQGAKAANNDFENQTKYAMIRNLFYQDGKTVEFLIAYEPKLISLLEWLKQLQAESLGKDKQGILPVASINTQDLHSLGQLIQEGNKIFFETVIKVSASKNELYINDFSRNLSEINNIACQATALAHLSGGVSTNIIEIDKLNEFNIGFLMQFFMTSCIISGYLEKVNPFNQNGVEAYKKNIKELLNINNK